jgi:hypothetical protein
MMNTFTFLDTIIYKRVFSLRQSLSSCYSYCILFLPEYEQSSEEEAYSKTDFKREYTFCHDEFSKSSTTRHL